MNEKLKAARQAGRVQRYHTTKLIWDEDVAQHTFNVLNLLMVMTQGQVSPNLLKAALLHDQGEYVTGDIPSPVKRTINTSAIEVMEFTAVNFIHYSGSPDLTDWEHKLLKTADNLDGLLKCTEEVGMGNCGAGPVGATYCEYLRQLLPELGGGPISDMVRDAIGEFNEVYK